MKNPYIALIFFLLFGSIWASTAQATTVVYPTGTFPTDVQNVQAAIDQGGTVLLKATDNVGHPLAFNFGTPEPDTVPPARYVFINDASVMGELVGTNRTTISGGSVPFRVDGGRNSIQGIKFNGPRREAIVIGASTGTSIIANEIDNVVPVDLLFGFTFADGIGVYALSPADISGNLVISGNTFGDLTGEFSIAIQVDTVAANVTISNNTFQLGQSATDLGFVNSSAIACIRCHSAVTISGNMITLGPGIVLGGISIIGGPDARYHVFGNTINTQSPFADGIDAVGLTGDPGATVSAVVESNSINLLNTDIQQGSGIGLLGTVTNSTIQGNVVTGNGPTALYAIGSLAPGEEVSNNRFVFNDIAQLAPSVATIFFDEQTEYNIVRGQCVSVLDLGLNNNISCPNPASHAASFPTATRQQLIQRALEAQSQVRALITERFGTF
jgi:hypothetical protein